MINILSNFKENLYDIIMEEGINFTELAKRTQMPSGKMSIYSRGFYLPNVENLLKIANYKNCSVDYLLGLTDSPEYTKSKKNLTFYEILIQLLKERKTSYYKVSKELHLSNSNLAKWKHGKVPKVETLYKLADKFGVSIDYLIGRSDN